MVSEQVGVHDQTLVVATLRLMESIFEEILVNSDGAGGAGMSVKAEDMSEEAANMITLRRETIECTILFSIVWSIGATGDEEGRKKFNEFLPAYLEDSNIIDKPEMKGVKTLLMPKLGKSNEKKIQSKQPNA